MKITSLQQSIGRLSTKKEKLELLLQELQENYKSTDSSVAETAAKKLLSEHYDTETEKLNEHRDEVIAKLQAASDNIKLTVGRWLQSKSFFTGSGGFGWYKNPTSCGGCHRGEQTVNLLDLSEYVQFHGDRQYGIPDDVFDKALAAVQKELGSTEAENTKKQIENTETELGSLKEQISQSTRTLNILKMLKSSKSDYEKVQKTIPDFIALCLGAGQGNKSLAFAIADAENRVGVMLLDDWVYYGSGGGSEYGVHVVVWRDGKSTQEYFKWRDAYSASNDKPWLNFQSVEILKVTKETVEVKLKSHKTEQTEVYALKQIKAKKVAKLSDAEQKKFKAHFDAEKARLLKLHFKEKAMMPDYVANAHMNSQVNWPAGAGPTGKDVPYEKPQIIDEYIDVANGVGALVIKAQIDHHAGRDKQHEWCVYRITLTKTEMKARDCAYEIEFRQSGKTISYKAVDYLS